MQSLPCCHAVSPPAAPPPALWRAWYAPRHRRRSTGRPASAAARAAGARAPAFSRSRLASANRPPQSTWRPARASVAGCLPHQERAHLSFLASLAFLTLPCGPPAPLLTLAAPCIAWHMRDTCSNSQQGSACRGCSAHTAAHAAAAATHEHARGPPRRRCPYQDRAHTRAPACRPRPRRGGPRLLAGAACVRAPVRGAPARPELKCAAAVRGKRGRDRGRRTERHLPRADRVVHRILALRARGRVRVRGRLPGSTVLVPCTASLPCADRARTRVSADACPAARTPCSAFAQQCARRTATGSKSMRLAADSEQAGAVSSPRPARCAQWGAWACALAPLRQPAAGISTYQWAQDSRRRAWPSSPGTMGPLAPDYVLETQASAHTKSEGHWGPAHRAAAGAPGPARRAR